MEGGPEQMEVVREDRDDHDAGWKLVSQGVSPARTLPVQEVQSDLIRPANGDEEESDDSSLVEVGPFVVEVKDTPWRSNGTSQFPQAGRDHNSPLDGVHLNGNHGTEPLNVQHATEENLREWVAREGQESLPPERMGEAELQAAEDGGARREGHGRARSQEDPVEQKQVEPPHASPQPWTGRFATPMMSAESAESLRSEEKARLFETLDNKGGSGMPREEQGPDVQGRAAEGGAAEEALAQRPAAARRESLDEIQPEKAEAAELQGPSGGVGVEEPGSAGGVEMERRESEPEVGSAGRGEGAGAVRKEKSIGGILKSSQPPQPPQPPEPPVPTPPHPAAPSACAGSEAWARVSEGRVEAGLGALGAEIPLEGRRKEEAGEEEEEGGSRGWGISLQPSKPKLVKSVSEMPPASKAPALWEKARKAFLEKRNEEGLGGNEERRNVANMWSVALQATLKSGLGLFRRPGRRDYSIHGTPAAAKPSAAKQTQTVDRQLLPHLAPVNVNLREVCEATGFAYAEVWLRQHRHVVKKQVEPEEEAEPSTGLRRSLDFNRLRRRSLDGLSRPVSQWAGALQRHSSFSPTPLRRGHSLTSHSHGPTDRSANNAMHRQASHQSIDSHHADEEHEQLAKRLRWTGYTFAQTEKFEAGEEKSLLSKGWRERLEEFRRQGEGRLQFYEKGKGFPGMAWARKELDWHDLAFLPEDDDLAADPRVMTAKTMFDFSVGVPVLDLDTGKLMAVAMLYHIPTKKTHRPMQNYKALSKNEKLVHMLTEFAFMAFHSLNMHETADEMNQVISKHCFTAEMQGSFRYPRARDEKPEEKDTAYTRIRHYWHKYFQKFKGQPEARIPSGHPWQFCLLAGFGTFLGIFAITAADDSLRDHDFDEGGRDPENPTGRPLYPVLLINSFAAVAAMLFSASTSPLVQPRAVVGGHLIAAVVSVGIDHLSNPEFGSLVPEWVATPLAPAAAIGLMAKTGLTHPPACAAAVIFMVGEPEIKNMGWWYIAVPVLADCILLIIIAVIINNLSKDRHYPAYW